MFKEMEIHEAEPELLAEPLRGAETPSASGFTDVQVQEDVDLGAVVGQTQGSMETVQVKPCSCAHYGVVLLAHNLLLGCALHTQGPSGHGAVAGVFTSLRRSFLRRGAERSGSGDSMATPTPVKSKSASTPVPRE